ncbi:MAG: hypothetical protein A3G34_01480 [Candidatus Lindowbacteria bacterium RIFCSPLOWO2_12_FULL_62_27]|nr:MAG: hypothetical protein A3G34_01480 [Candidatus Lindowbacteria bacterium RIFCSPLOWO2_12_FULL_62_27]OGH61922.1 MAG: hypothetical protein A3I06_03495 [Candidatus Lindowbacteria bacterium RIFCSPLOWO2_02_FULL_62_12]
MGGGIPRLLDFDELRKPVVNRSYPQLSKYPQEYKQEQKNTNSQQQFTSYSEAHDDHPLVDWPLFLETLRQTV